jgi:hypothetical protein
MSVLRQAGLVVLVAFASAAVSASPINVGSITYSRFGQDWSLDGPQMANTRAKLLNTSNFGSAGVVRRTIAITDTGGAVGSIDAPLLDQFDVFFVGWFSDFNANAFTAAELDAFRAWVYRGGTLIVTCDDENVDATCLAFGYPAGGDLNTVAVPAAGAEDHPLVHGPFGAVAEVQVRGSFSSFTDSTGATVVMRDTSAFQRPVVMVRQWGSGRVILFTDVDIIANAASGDSAISNDNDRFLGNLFAYAARPYDLLLDAAAHTGGLSGTEWRSDVDLLNRGPSDASVSVALLKVSQSNLNPAVTPVTVPAGRSLRLYDVLAGLFTANNAAFGLSFAGAEIHANSRFYNVGSAAGVTYGMYVPSTDDRETVWYGRSGAFHHLSYTPGSTSGSRVNIGGASRVPFPAQVLISLYGDLGELLATRTHTFQPYEHRQFTKINEALGTPAVTHGHAIVEVQTPGAAVDMYAMLIENASGDPIFMPPSFNSADDADAVVASAGAPRERGGVGVAAAPVTAATAACSGPYHRIIAAAANTTGANSTKWLSDVDLLNLGAGTAIADIALLKANQANLNPLVSSVEVAPGRTVRLANILGTALPAGNAGLGVRFCSGEVLANSRFYNTGSASGSVYGMYIPSRSPSDGVTPCRPGVFHHLSYSPDPAAGQRINIGATNAGAIPTTWVIRLYGDGGALIGSKTSTLAPFEHRQFTNIHKLVGTSAVSNGWASVQVTTPGGLIHPYAMRIENVGGDPIYMPPDLESASTTAAVAASFAGVWQGAWSNTTFATGGAVSLSLEFDLPNQRVTGTLDLDGSVFGLGDPPAETLTGTLTPDGIVFAGTSVALGNYRLELDSGCSLTGTLTGLPSIDLYSLDLAGTIATGEISIAYTIYFSASGGGGTANGTLLLTR